MFSTRFFHLHYLQLGVRIVLNMCGTLNQCLNIPASEESDESACHSHASLFHVLSFLFQWSLRVSGSTYSYWAITSSLCVVGVTNCKEKSHSWESDGRSAKIKLPNQLCGPKVHYRFTNLAIKFYLDPVETIPHCCSPFL